MAVVNLLGLGPLGEDYYSGVTRELINPNADECAVKLYEFLADNYGKMVLSGQYINLYDNFSTDEFRVDENDPNSPSTVFKSLELRAVSSVTNKFPAVIGLDFSGVENGMNRYTVEQAIEYHKAGGIVTFCWHWLAPTADETDDEQFYSDQTDFDLAAALNDKESAEYKGLISDIDAVSARLKILRDEGVPVLWRPLHEASGKWFWWGNSGAKAYKELWDIMYDRMTNYHELNNLIWVCNAQSPLWYVGDDKCDIIAEDPYYPNNSRFAFKLDPANYFKFKNTYHTTHNKIIAMSENGTVPDIDKVFEYGVCWSMFATWCREFVCTPGTDPEKPWEFTTEYNEKYTTAKELKKVYDDERVFTLENLVASGEYITN